MRKEIFGDQSSQDRNLTPVQQEYADERRRSRRIAFGELDRPWCSIMYVLWPTAMRKFRGIIPNFAPASEVRVVTLTRPEHVPHRRDAGRTQATYPVLLTSPWVDSDGTVRVGGSVGSTIGVYNYIIPPYRDSYASYLSRVTGDLTCIKRNERHVNAEQFVVRRDEKYLYLCVGNDANNRNEPMIQYRFELNDIVNSTTGELLINITAEKRVKPGDVLCQLPKGPKPIPFEVTEFDAQGMPKIDYRPVGSMSGTRFVSVISALNKASRQQNDRVFSNGEQTVTEFRDSLAPRLMVKLPREIAENLRGQSAFVETPWLQTRIMQACGTGPGLYYLRAEFDGTVEDVVSCPNQPHFKSIVYNTGDRQLVPSCSILSLDVGKTVRYGEPIGDICERHNLQSWSELEDLIGVHRDHYLLNSFLREQMIRPGQDGWSGPEYLCDIRVAQPLMSSFAGSHNEALVWDFRPSRSFCTDNGVCVLPPFFQDTPVDQLINGAEYVMRRFDLRGRGRSAASAHQPAAASA